MKCKMCGKSSGNRKTCTDKCLSILRSQQATKNRRNGVSWGDIKVGGSVRSIPNYSGLIK